MVNYDEMKKISIILFQKTFELIFLIWTLDCKCVLQIMSWIASDYKINIHVIMENW